MSNEPKEIVIPSEPSPEMRQAAEFVERMRLELEHMMSLADPTALFAQREESTGQTILRRIAATHLSPPDRPRETARQEFVKWREGDDYRPNVVDN